VRTVYDKLIRDRIPELLQADGVRYEVAELDEAAFRAALLVKLGEEAAEVAAADVRGDRVKELADLLEVIETLMAVEGIGWDEVRNVQQERRAARGGFSGRLVLRWTGVEAGDDDAR
jgi:predicted house-cleaning noncanonical NTP pyrophosphatase (MazG superfamily)